MSVQSPVTLRCGDAWVFNGPLTNPDGSIPNLTGASISMKIDALDFSQNVLTLSLGFGIVVSNPATATVQYGPSATQTAGITPGTYYYTLRVVLSDGSAYTYAEGIINATPMPA